MSATPDNAWQPILEASDAEDAWSVIREIAVMLRQAGPPGLYSPTGLATGAAGVALFYRELDLACPGEGYDQDIVRCLEIAAECEDKRLVLFNGTPGVAWVTETIIGGWDGEADVYDELDEIIGASAAAWPITQYDLISGIAGIGVYTLARLPRPRAIANVSRIVSRLADAATRGPDGAAWFTTLEQAVAHAAQSGSRYDRGVGCYNLGVAHGAPGVLAFLGMVCASEHAPDLARELLTEGMTWLLARRHPDVGYGPYLFPGEAPARCPPAWCYGNPGVAVAMMVAGGGAGRPDWVEAGADLLACEAVRPIAEPRVDLGLCHGAMGVAHLYNRGYQITRRRELAESSRTWAYQALLSQHRNRGGAADPGGAGRLKDHSFLLGAAGVGLALLGLVTRPQSGWDQALLLSLPT